jgi:hypothetical protein
MMAIALVGAFRVASSLLSVEVGKKSVAELRDL